MIGREGMSRKAARRHVTPKHVMGRATADWYEGEGREAVSGDAELDFSIPLLTR